MDSEGTRSQKADDAKLGELGSSRPTSTEAPRVEVSAATVTRMMGIATVTDLKLLESRVDLLTAKVTSIMTKIDKVLSNMNGLPSGSDMDRIEVQLGSIKSVMKEILENVSDDPDGKKEGNKAVASEQSRKLREGIRSSSDSEE